MRRFTRPRFLLAYALIAVLVGAGIFIWVRHGGTSVQYRTAAATLGTVTQTVSLAGSLTPTAATDLQFTTGGRVTAVNVTAGQMVAAGTTLATVDATTAQDQLATAEATLQSAQARLSLDEAGPTPQNLASAEGQVSGAEVSLQNAETSYTDTTAINAETVDQAQATLQSAQTQEQDDCGSNPSSTQCHSDQQAVQQDQFALDSATLRAEQSNDQARGQMETAQVQLQNAQQSLTALRQGTTPQQIDMDKSQVDIDQISVQSAQTAVNGATLVTPVAGVVAEVNIVPGDEVSGSGGGSSSTGSASASSTSSSSGASPAIIVETPGLFDVTGSVSDAQVNTIAVGQEAEVTPAGAQEAATGHVTQIAQVATVSSGVATFPVTVTLDQADPSLRSGMSASVSVVVNRVVQVLTVPTSAVHTTSAGTTVEVLVDGAPQTRVVQVGAQDSQRTQILSGLNAGDQVVIATITGSVPTSGSGSGLFGGGGRGTGGGFGGGGFTGTGRGTGG